MGSGDISAGEERCVGRQTVMQAAPPECERPTPWTWAIPTTGGLWLLLLAAMLLAPHLGHSATPGADWTRNTVRLALLYYGAGASLMILRGAGGARGKPGAWLLARWCWTLGWAAYLLHLGMAFHHYHHWSHAAAIEHTRAVSGVGEGIYVSHLFTLAWTADVITWWWRPLRHASRPVWLGGLLQGFMAFVVFNATVVYETGLIRWTGLLLFTLLAALWLYRRRRQREPVSGPEGPGPGSAPPR